MQKPPWFEIVGVFKHEFNLKAKPFIFFEELTATGTPLSSVSRIAANHVKDIVNQTKAQTDISRFRRQDFLQLRLSKE